MPSGELLDRWHIFERRAVDWASQAASWTGEFFDCKSKLFRVSIDGGSTVDGGRTEPNASTSLIGLTMKRCGLKSWTLRHPAWDSLEAKITASAQALVSFPTSSVLPLRSFGVLPLFSTSYLAAWMPHCLPPGDLVSNPAYVISLRRIICELFDLTAHNTFGPYRKSMHPFLLCNVMRALRTLQSILNEAHGNLTPTLTEALRNGDALVESLGSTDDDRINKDEFAQAIKLGSVEFDDHLAKHGLANVLTQMIHFIELTADNDLLAEFANLNRPNGRAADPASLAYAMQILAEINPRSHMAVLMQGLQLLLRVVSQGSFLPGQPFHSDSKGRALFVPSIEIANIAISIFVDHLREAATEELMAQIIDKTTEIQDLLLDQCNEFEIQTEEGRRAIGGWCSDRAPSLRRIDSWVTVQVLEFFVNRLNLLRWSKRASVFSEYNVRSYSDCRPPWEKVQDPDEGHLQSQVKKVIWDAVAASTRQSAPVFLLYGPPGTSKTTLATALAAEKKWDLILLSPSDFVADSLDRIELRSRKIFKDLMMVDKCVILMDEMDSLFRDRRAFRNSPGTIIEYIIPALLPKLQDLREYAMTREIAIFYVTNYLEAIDSAISRGGRMDNRLLILPYSRDARTKVAKAIHAEVEGSAESLKILNEVLEGMPCNLVYRDVENLVKIASSGATRERLLEIAKSSGIGPEVYDPDQRPEAYKEFCWFAARLTNQEINEKSISSKTDAQQFLVRCMAAIQNKPEFGSWSNQMTRWQELLNHR